MNSFLLILLGAILGAVIGWLLAAARSRAELVKSQIDAEGRVKGAESTLQEVRAQLGALRTALEGRERELAELQQRLREESEQKVKAQTELLNARSALEDSNQLRERLKVEGERAEATARRSEEDAYGNLPGPLFRGAQEQ